MKSFFLKLFLKNGSMTQKICEKNKPELYLLNEKIVDNMTF